MPLPPLIMQKKHSLLIPRYLKAATPQGLEKAMFKNNVKRRAFHDYKIVFDGKAWFAWYYADVSGTYNQEINEVEG